MGSNIVATLKEGFATTPGITAVDLAVLTRLPDTPRLGLVAYGRCGRRAIESTPWRNAEDAMPFLDIGQDVTCSVTTTASSNLSSTIKPLDTARVPGLQELLDHAQDEPDAGEPSLADLDISLGVNARPNGGNPVVAPYRIKSFADWRQETSSAPPPMTSAPPAEPTALIPGQTLILPDEAWHELHIAFGFAGADADLTLFLTTDDGRVASNEDFVFYNQPSAADSAARLLGKHPRDCTPSNAPPSACPRYPDGSGRSPSPSPWAQG